MNAHVIRISGSAWRPRKGGSVKLVIEVRPETQAEWVDALEMFKQRPELSVSVVAPYVAPAVTVITDKRYDRDGSSWSKDNRPYPNNEGDMMKETVAAIKGNPDFVKHDFSKVAFDAASMPKADVDCPEPECNRELGHTGEHLFDGIPLPPMPSATIADCPKPDCNLLAGHKGKCVKKKVAK